MRGIVASPLFRRLLGLVKRTWRAWSPGEPGTQSPDAHEPDNSIWPPPPATPWRHAPAPRRRITPWIGPAVFGLSGAITGAAVLTCAMLLLLMSSNDDTSGTGVIIVGVFCLFGGGIGGTVVGLLAWFPAQAAWFRRYEIGRALVARLPPGLRGKAQSAGAQIAAAWDDIPA
jgi:hypothetical protein